VSTRNIILGSVAVVAILAVLWFIEDSKPGDYDEFAKCLTESNATFYGTYWCPHCLDQKEEFGKSMEYINHVECSLPNRAGQTQECQDAGIRGYPTWIFGDGTVMPGKLSFEQLSTMSGCPLPS
jgi:hypothetical protein